MRCKDINIEVVSGKPFEGDKLGRYPLAQNLTEIMDAYSDTGVVLAINGEWGAGKTTFVKMWCQWLSDKDYSTIYFNAWQVDYQDDPFTAMMAELETVFKSSKGFEEVLRSGAQIGLRITGEIAKGLLKKATGIEYDNAINAGVDEAVEIYKKSLTEYNTKKGSFEDFKKKLSEFVASESGNHPVYFFIDELDRCNPRFAVKLLERVKHLFEVPNIIFVLAVNIEQLQYAVQGYFGSSNIDGKEYLRRFIDIEYILPAPNIEKYCEMLYSVYGLGEYFECKERQCNGELRDAGQMFQDLATDIISASKLNLRAVNKLYAYTRLSLNGMGKTAHFSGSVFFLLCYFKITNPRFYQNIKNGEYSLQGLLDAIENQLPNGLYNSPDEYVLHRLSYASGCLLIRYNYPDGNGLKREINFKSTEIDGKNIYPIKSNHLDLSQLNEALNYYSNNRYCAYGLKSLFNKIDLIDSMHMLQMG